MEKFADAAETWCSLGLGHDYEVSNLGRVRHAETSEIISPTKTRYGELVLNLKTAKALGLTFPLPLLGRADEVIE